MWWTDLKVLIQYSKCDTPAKITFGAKEKFDFDPWFLVNFRNISYNACTITANHKVDVKGVTSECTLNLNITYCGHQNLTEEYKILIVESQRVKNNISESRERRELDEKLTNSSVKNNISESRERRELDEKLTNSSDLYSGILDELNSLLDHGNLSIASSDVRHVLDRVDAVLNIERMNDVPGQLLQGLDKLGTRFKLDAEFTGCVVRDNIAMLVVDSTPDLRLRGMRILAMTNNNFIESAFEYITEEDEDTLHTTTEKYEAVILWPHSATRFARRISMVAFRTRHQKSFTNPNDQLNSKILSINVENYTTFDAGEMIDIYMNPFRRVHNRNQSRACAYWHFNEDGTGFWSQEGCMLIKSHQEHMLDLCQCNHLTHFAEVLIHRNVFSEYNESALEIVSIIGCCFSLFGLTVIALTAALFKPWRENESNQIWLNLGSAVFVLDVCFLLTVFLDFDNYVAGCVVVGAALHYAVLATFCWMLIVSILSFRKLVLVFSSELPCKLLLTALFAWGFPFLVIGILFAVNPNAYSGRFEEMTPSGKFCYPKGIAFWASVFGPMAAMWFVNWTLYAIIVRSMFESKKTIRRHTSSKETLRCASISCLLAFLCGIPWVFGFFAYNIVAAYLFSITVTFQGFVLFLFFILGNRTTRGLWISLFRIKSRRAEFVHFTDRSNKDAATVRSLFINSSSNSQDRAATSLLAETRL